MKIITTIWILVMIIIMVILMIVPHDYQSKPIMEQIGKIAHDAKESFDKGFIDTVKVDTLKIDSLKK